MTKILLAAAFIATVAMALADARIVTNGSGENSVALNGVGDNGVGLNGIGGLSHRGLNGTVIRIEF